MAQALVSKLRCLSNINRVSNLPAICSYQQTRQKKYLTWPNNWLPFEWEPPEQTIGYFESGDPEEKIYRNPERYKKHFEFLENDEE